MATINTSFNYYNNRGNVTIHPENSKNPKKKNLKVILSIVGLVASVSTIAGLSMKSLLRTDKPVKEFKHDTISQSLKDSLETVIRNGNTAAFNAYKSVPFVNMDEVGNYYMPGESRYKEIVGIVSRGSTAGFCLMQIIPRPSKYMTFVLLI